MCVCVRACGDRKEKCLEVSALMSEMPSALFSVVVPPGVYGGQELEVEAPNGQVCVSNLALLLLCFFSVKQARHHWTQSAVTRLLLNHSLHQNQSIPSTNEVTQITSSIRQSTDRSLAFCQCVARTRNQLMSQSTHQSFCPPLSPWIAPTHSQVVPSFVHYLTQLLCLNSGFVGICRFSW